MSWTCELCERRTKQINEPDCVARFGDFTLQLCYSCTDKISAALLHWLRNFIQTTTHETTE